MVFRVRKELIVEVREREGEYRLLLERSRDAREDEGEIGEGGEEDG